MHKGLLQRSLSKQLLTVAENSNELTVVNFTTMVSVYCTQDEVNLPLLEGMA